jgi:DNA-binding MarR family transcriptional regulator
VAITSKPFFYKGIDMGNYVNINFDIMSELDLTHKEIMVLNYIDSMCKNGVQEYCFASNKAICGSLNITQRTLYRILNTLEDRKLIRRVTKSIGNDGKIRKIFSQLPSAKVADIYT